MGDSDDGPSPASPTSPALAPADNFDAFIKVSASDDPLRLGGKVAWNSRRGENRPMLASGSPAIHAAVEAVSIARRFLSQDDQPSELLCQPAFRDENKGSSLALYLFSSRFRKSDFDSSPANFSVSRHSKPAIVAGAIAARAREGVGALVTAIGAEAVANALVAAAWARLYLEDDKLDIRVVLTAQRLQKTGGDGQTQQLATTLMKVYVDEVQ